MEPLHTILIRWELRKIDTTTGSVIWEWDSDTGAACRSRGLEDRYCLPAMCRFIFGRFGHGKETWRSRLHRQTVHAHHCLWLLVWGDDKRLLEEYVICDRVEE